MIGIIVTGHGSFATGLTSGLKLLAGELEYYAAVDFEPEDSIDLLTDKLTAALAELESCDSVAMFADLTGGSPFNVASRLKLKTKEKDIEVAGGTSLPVVLNAYLTRTVAAGSETLVDNSLEAGKEQLVRFEYEAGTDSEDECEEIEA